MRTRSATTVEELLAPYDGAVRELATELRRLVRAHVVEVEERVYPGWRGIGYRDAQAGYFCGIFPQPDHVRLLFERGRELSDPDGLLQGGGTQTRHIPLRPGQPLPTAAIHDLLDQALRRGALP